MEIGTATRLAGGAALGGAAALAAYLGVIRPWQLRWGATDAEVARAMPGDDLVSAPTFGATRAVTVAAKPEDVWPWLVQIGCTRAGMYSVDWIDNGRKPSAERILPEHQHIEVGQLIPMTTDGKQGMLVKAFAPNKHVLWVAKDGRSSWVWGLYPQDDGTTRLVTRLRVRYDWRPPWLFYYLLQDVGDIVMIRASLLGIKRRAEALVGAGMPEAAAA
jgi:hypothetical protein